MALCYFNPGYSCQPSRSIQISSLYSFHNTYLMKILYSSILLLLFNLSANAQTPEEYVKRFFIEYDSLGAKASLEKLYATNPWMSRNQDAINNLIAQFESYNEELIGKYYGYEMITTKRLGQSYVLMSYLMKFDRQPLRATFQFYKPQDNWRLFAFQFDDNFDEELEQSAQIQMLSGPDKN